MATSGGSGTAPVTSLPWTSVSWDGRAARRCATSGHEPALPRALAASLWTDIVKSRSSDQAMAVELHDDNALVIYTDGSCLQKPRRGGYASVQA